jgi:hypothetical protein
MPQIDLSILNQRQTPAFYADVFANRPAAGFVGRIFVSTNTFAFYRDNGTGWDLIGGPGTGTITGSGAAGQVSFWNGASTITGENNLWWDSANNHLGINTNTPATALDVNHNGTLIAKFNNTTSANSLVAFENAGNEQWWIGTENTNNDFLFYDATNFPTLSLRTTFKTNGQVLIGGGSTGSGKLVVESAASDNGIQIVGASAPSLRIDSAATGPTKRIGLGISTATNNFIQGSADRDMCIFNGSTTASPILFGIYDTTNVQEAARISAARNFLIGTTTDGGQKLQVNGGSRTTGYFLDGMTAGAGALYWGSLENRVTLANYNVGGILRFEVNGGSNALTINSDLSSTFLNNIRCSNTNGIITLANGNTASGTKIQSFNAAGNADGYLSFEGFTKEYARFNADGNLGLGVLPNAWNSAFTAFQIGQTVSLSATSTRMFLAQNYYEISGGASTYLTTNPATRYDQFSGQHVWFNAPSGTAGNSITFTQAMTLNSIGNLGIGASSPTAKLDVVVSDSATDVYAFSASNATNASLEVYLKSNVTTLNAGGSGTFVFANGNKTERMRLAAGTGNLLIGTTTDDGTKLQVKGNVKFGAGNGNRAILDSNDSVVTLAPGGTADFDNFSGMLLVCNHNTGGFQIFVCGGGSTASVYLLGGSMGTFTYNLGINGYTFTNNTASTYIYNLTAFRTRANA